MKYGGADLVVVIPLWRRTKHIRRVVDSVHDATPAARVLFVVSEQDDAVIGALASHDERVVVSGAGGGHGDYAKKINVGYRGSSEPFIFTGADDLVFHGGWYDAARAFIADYDPDVTRRLLNPDHPERVDIDVPVVGVVGTVDLCNARTMNGTHSTHSLVARWYADLFGTIDGPGAIYAECYVHEYCDDEMVQTAMSRGAYAHALDAVVEHLHPNVHKSVDDPTYARGRVGSRLSRRTFLVRRRRWPHIGRD